jgi:thiamine kinase-like enzyme
MPRSDLPSRDLPSRDPKTIARFYVPGAGALSIERLGSGLVNESFRVVRAGRRYSLRIPALQAEDLGLDRAWECRVLARAAAAGVAPVIERCEPPEGVLVARWVDGLTWTRQQVREPANIRAVALLARRIHGLTIPEVPRQMSPANWIAYYRAALERRGLGAGDAAAGDTAAVGTFRRPWPELEGGLAARSAALAALPSAPAVLCHSDLHVANLVVGAGGMTLLDWEYAHVSEPLWDLAGWTCNNDLSAEARHLLLASYLGRAPRDEEAERLDHLAWFYDYVCVLWSELFAARGSAEGQGVAARARALVERLKSASVVVEPGNFRHTTRL